MPHSKPATSADLQTPAVGTTSLPFAPGLGAGLVVEKSSDEKKEKQVDESVWYGS